MTARKPMVATAGSDPVAPPRLPSLTGLRWVGAMLVFGFHLGTMHVIADPDYARVLNWLFTLGLSGVQFFFILSGFVLVWSARPGDSPLSFWQRRIAKIYPSHVFMWAVVIGFGLYWAYPQNPKVALANLFLVQAWTPSPGYFYSVNTVSWSLSCEMFFYLCLPLALPLIRRMRPWMLWAVIGAMPLLILSLGPVQHLVPEADRWWFTQVFPVARSLEFWLGVAAAELTLRGLWRGPGLRLASAVFAVTWVVSTEWIPGGFWTTVLAAVYLLVIAAAAQADIRGTRSPWRSRPMVWLGEVSFAFYLVHVFVVLTILRLTGHPRGLPGWRGPAAAVGFLLLNLFLAWLLFRFVETPMMRLLKPSRRLLKPSRQRPEKPASRPFASSAPAGASILVPAAPAVADQPTSHRPAAVADQPTSDRPAAVADQLTSDRPASVANQLTSERLASERLASDQPNSERRPTSDRPVAVPRPRAARPDVAGEDHDSQPHRTGDLAPDRA